MVQTLVALGIVAMTSGWMLWRAVGPALARGKSTPAQKDCGCDSGGACEPKKF